MGAVAFFLALFLSLPSQEIISRSSLYSALAILLLVVLLGVVFDMVGVAATAAEEAPFHAMAAKKVPGARQAVYLVRHADRVSSFANDLIGDIAASVSGGAALALVYRLSAPEWAPLGLALVSALTIGGKAATKGLALKHAVPLVLWAGRVVSLFWRGVGRP
jgi:CBS domain containing-hemolysin-like protein